MRAVGRYWGMDGFFKIERVRFLSSILSSWCCAAVSVRFHCCTVGFPQPACCGLCAGHERAADRIGLHVRRVRHLGCACLLVLSLSPCVVFGNAALAVWLLLCCGWWLRRPLCPPSSVPSPVVAAACSRVPILALPMALLISLLSVVVIQTRSVCWTAPSLAAWTACARSPVRFPCCGSLPC